MSELKHVDDDGDLNVFVVGSTLLITCSKDDDAWVGELTAVQDASKEARESLTEAAKGAAHLPDSRILREFLLE
jgi:hypothetical protein